MMNKRKRFIRVFGMFFLLVGSMVPHSTLRAGSVRELMPLSLTNSLPESRIAVPLTWSVPLAPGDEVFATGTLVLMRGGEEVPAQFTPMARWGGTPQDAGKPLAWVLVDAQVDLAPAETASFSLGMGQSSSGSSPLRIAQDDDDQIVVATGAATYAMSKRSFRFFDTVTLQDGLTIQGVGGILFRGGLVADAAEIRPEHVGDRRLSLQVKGRVDGNLKYTARLHFYANLAEVKVDFRLENLNPPAVDYFGQPQANDYGAVRSVNFDDLSIVIPAGTAKTFCLPLGELGAGGEREGTFGERLVVVQESSGDANWNVLQEFAPRLQSGVSKRASTLLVDGTTEDGPNQIAGWLDANGVTVAVEGAWQNFPKALRAGSGSVEIGLFPGEFSRNHELRPGEFKTHTFWVRHHHGAEDVGARARSFLSTLRLQPSVERIAASQAAGLFAPRMDALFPDYENGTDYQLVTSPEWREEYESRNVLDAISRTQSYGWVDYGDIPTDFEGKYSPYNLKYDGMRGLILHALRNSSNETWWQLAAAGARHLADIDIQHSQTRGYTAPRSWYEGGMYGHGYHDEDGRMNPHHNYQNPVTYLAGPNAGMFLWALVSGDTLVLDSALELADNLYWKTVNSDYHADFYGQVPEESRRCAQDAGLQLCDEGECYGYEPADGSRTGGNVVKAMLLAYMATGDSAYLNLISHLSAYVHCMETQVTGPSCDRFHFQTTFVRNLGHYLLFLDHINSPDDAIARDLLALRMDYMVNTLWDSRNREFRMCYDGADLFSFHDNWLFSVADALAVGALVLGRPELLEDYAQILFLDGARNQFYQGSALSYHSTKEFVNQVGFGNMFLFAWNRRATIAPPAAPTGLAATNVSGSRVDLLWADSSNNEEGFEVESCEGSGCTDFEGIATVGANISTYSNTDLTAGVTYSYRVRAYNSEGSSTYSDTATATVFSDDSGIFRLIWTHTSGQVSMWRLDASDNRVGCRNYGPYSGWTAKLYHRNSDGTGRLIWAHTTGQVSIWTMDAWDNRVKSTNYGPYSGWTAIAYDENADGTGRLLWTHTSGQVSIWRLDSSDNRLGCSNHGPYSGWRARLYNSNADGTARLLWEHTTGWVSHWELDSLDNRVGCNNYGPYSGWRAKLYHSNLEGTGRLLWEHNTGWVSHWQLDSSGNHVGCNNYGPYSGWRAKLYHGNADGTGRLLWEHTTGWVSHWQLDSSGNYVGYSNYGPFEGWAPIAYE